jgi:hypothetical protein
MQFDPTTPNRMIVGVSGSGVYVSTNANLGTSATWTLVTSSSTTPGYGKFASDGNYYFNNQAQGSTLWRIDGANTLTSSTPSVGKEFQSFAIDPNNPARMVAIVHFGQFIVGGPINGTAAWSTANSGLTVTATDAPWLGNANWALVSPGDMSFDPFKTTSAVSQTIDNTAAKTFNDLPTGLNLVAGDTIRITDTGTPANYMLRTVSSYSGTTLVTSTTGPAPGGYLGTATGGSAGPFNTWTITKERLWLATGVGMFYTDTFNISGNGNVTWNSVNFGIEDMVARHVIWPTGNVPVVAFADKPIFQITNNPWSGTVGASSFGPNANTSLQQGTDIDWDGQTPTTIVTTSGGGGTFNGKNLASGAPGSWSAFAISTGANSLIAAASDNNILVASPSGVHYSTTGGASGSWTAVPGLATSGFQANSVVSNPQSQSVCADKTTTDTFYLYQSTTGNVFKFVTSGPTLTSGATGIDPANQNGGYTVMKCAPGNAGHLFWTSGFPNNAINYTSVATILAANPTTTTNPFKFSSDGGATFTSLNTVSGVVTFGFSAAAAGQSYPSILIAGYVSSTYGLWRCDTFNPVSPAGSCTWNNVGTYARGWLDEPTTVEGDPSQWGRFAICHQGSSCASSQVTGQTNSWP